MASDDNCGGELGMRPVTVMFVSLLVYMVLSFFSCLYVHTTVANSVG